VISLKKNPIKCGRITSLENIDLLIYCTVSGTNTSTQPLVANDKSDTANSVIESEKRAEKKSFTGN
jgi:hypothetical protein